MAPLPALCSLRMWGLREGYQHVADAPQMFPTHVGIARTSGRRMDMDTHVPYACGDCAALRAVRAYSSQCSLRMWGLRALEGIASSG